MFLRRDIYAPRLDMATAPTFTESPSTKPVKPSIAKRVLRVREAAHYLGISPWKLRRLVQDGLLPIVQDRDEGPWRVDVYDLDAYIDRHKRSEPL